MLYFCLLALSLWLFTLLFLQVCHVAMPSAKVLERRVNLLNFRKGLEILRAN